ncbi:MAG: GIY-YIG nuclease family protein [Gammaproteobacteria bacterium]|nr:GIY-YIG nuclease family protein [Gammaproteobacteria bacterium]MCW8911590.1 GIY-YIG nuclease family protein [Gammaproteobacteria bacterium]
MDITPELMAAQVSDAFKNAISKNPGTYILCLKLNLATQIMIGKLGTFNFKPGYYYYVGSAFGPGGILARCGHHIKISTRPRWHIDYLRQHCVLDQILYSDAPDHLEHWWANWLSGITYTTIPIADFGSSDCQCTSHLFFSPENISDLLLDSNKSISAVLNPSEIS